MNCLNSELIQKYIDGEASPKEVTRLENHIRECGKCTAKIDLQRKLAENVKRAINIMVENNLELPTIKLTPSPVKEYFFTARRILYIVAAACILIFVIVIRSERSENIQNVITIEPGFAHDIDANRPVSQQSLVITIVDSEGNVSEYFD